eukprot:273342-Chlamydomonas_euryale.AAC.1
MSAASTRLLQRGFHVALRFGARSADGEPPVTSDSHGSMFRHPQWRNGVRGARLLCIMHANAGRPRHEWLADAWRPHTSRRPFASRSLRLHVALHAREVGRPDTARNLHRHIALARQRPPPHPDRSVSPLGGTPRARWKARTPPTDLSNAPSCDTVLATTQAHLAARATSPLPRPPRPSSGTLRVPPPSPPSRA